MSKLILEATTSPLSSFPQTTFPSHHKTASIKFYAILEHIVFYSNPSRALVSRLKVRNNLPWITPIWCSPHAIEPL